MTTGQDNHERLSLADVARRASVVIALVVSSALLIVVVYDLRTILVWLLIAALLAMTFAPAVAWLQRRRVPRWLGASLVILAAALVVGAVSVAVAVPLVSQSRELLGNLPDLTRDLFKPGEPLAFLEQRFHLQGRIGTITPDRFFDLVAGPSSIVSVFTRMAAIVVAIVTIVTVTLMLLVEGPRTWEALVDSLGQRGRRVDDVGRRMQGSVAGYVRGNLLVSALASTSSFAAMSILGVPYALPLALAVGLLAIIPMVGATLSAVLCAVVALSVSWPATLALIAYFVVYQQIENFFLVPVIYSRTIAMSPLTVLLVSLAGAVLGGFVGVLIAIPLSSVVAIAMGELLRSKGVEDLADLAEVMTEEGPLSEDDEEEAL